MLLFFIEKAPEELVDARLSANFKSVPDHD